MRTKQVFWTWYRPKSLDITRLLDSRVFPDELRERIEFEGYIIEDDPAIRINRHGRSWSISGYVFKLRGRRLAIYRKEENCWKN